MWCSLTAPTSRLVVILRCSSRQPTRFCKYAPPKSGLNHLPGLNPRTTAHAFGERVQGGCSECPLRRDAEDTWCRLMIRPKPSTLALVSIGYFPFIEIPQIEVSQHIVAELQKRWWSYLVSFRVHHPEPEVKWPLSSGRSPAFLTLKHQDWPFQHI